jgi:hypothetical protein
VSLGAAAHWSVKRKMFLFWEFILAYVLKEYVKMASVIHAFLLATYFVGNNGFYCLLAGFLNLFLQP